MSVYSSVTSAKFTSRIAISTVVVDGLKCMFPKLKWAGPSELYLSEFQSENIIKKRERER